MAENLLEMAESEVPSNVGMEFIGMIFRYLQKSKLLQIQIHLASHRMTRNYIPSTRTLEGNLALLENMN